MTYEDWTTQVPAYPVYPGAEVQPLPPQGEDAPAMETVEEIDIKPF